jgi:micrococcal nuclease
MIKKKVTNKVASNFFQNKKNKLAVLFSLLTLLIGFLGGTTYLKYSQKENEYPQKAKVIRVLDGDTIELDNGKPFRLNGVACPDEGEKYFQEAKDFTQDKVLNKKVNLEYEEKYKKDSYQRLLGYVFINDENLNVELVRNGLCKVVLYSKRAKLIYQDELVEAEDFAKRKEIGLWEK